MTHETDEELYAQCLCCIEQGISTNKYTSIEPPVDEFAERIAQQVSTNQMKKRVPQARDRNPLTGVPESYIHVIISYTLDVGPKIKQLKSGDGESWDEIMLLIKQRASTKLRRYESQYGCHFHGLVDEFVQHCATVLWINLDRYTFDTNLESWVSQFVAFEISTERSRSDFKWNSTAWSLDQPVGFVEGASTLGELIPDNKAANHYEMVDLYLTILGAVRFLSPDQFEVIWRTLIGQKPQEIAEKMGKDRNAIYQIKHRAIKILKKLIG